MGGGHRPERSGQDDASEGDRAARALRRRDRARRPAYGLDAPRRALSAGGSGGAGSVDSSLDDRRRVRPARADAASRPAREGGEARPRRGRARSRPPRSLRLRRASSSGTLSGGEKQRVVVARALAQEAKIVLLDEPTAALDIGHQQQALELLDALRAESELTLVAAMHDLTLAAQYAERMVLLDQGRIVADGPPRTRCSPRRRSRVTTARRSTSSRSTAGSR